MIYPVKTPAILTKMYPSLTWFKNRGEKTIYLTFDDGPSPGITNWVLDMLKKHKAKACFFLIGDKIQKYPDTFDLILQHDQQIGNHTYNHLNGWRTVTKDYITNFNKCAELMDTPLFRPPYGRIKASQIKALKDQKIIMWDVLSGDFDPKLSKEDCLLNLINNVENGSIIVMHDSEKAKEKVLYVLPRFLAWAEEKGFSFGLL